MRMVSLFVAALLLGSAAGCAGRRPLVQTDDPLRVSRVVLYQNGLAHVERRGVTNKRSIELRARREQIDDVLKSLTVVDRSGSQVASVRVRDSVEEAETVTLQVGLTEEGQHDLSISYVAEMSGWRPTYRIVAGEGGQVRLQGLAVVDNQSGESWRDITLTLSTDLPLSFRYALRAPAAVRRPELTADGRLISKALPAELQLAQLDSLNPEELPEGPRSNIQAAYSLHNAYMPQISTRAGVQLRGGVPVEQEAAPAAAQTVDPLNALDRTQGVLGVLLEGQGHFDLAEGESGMVPFVDQATEGEVVLLYKPATQNGPSASRPYQAALFRNPLDAPLLTGPVAVYDEDQFLGDGVTGTIPAGTHAFVAFALDPSVQIEQSTERGEDDLRALSLRAGLLTVELQATQRTNFRVSASRDIGRRLYLFVPALDGYELRDPPDGTISTEAGFYVPAPGDGRQREVAVEQVRQQTSEVNIAADPNHSYVPALLVLLASTEGINLDQLSQVAGRLEDLAVEEARWREDLAVHREALTERRQALESLRDIPANGALRRRLAAGVGEGVAQVDELTRHIVEANAEAIALRQEWFETLRTLIVDHRA